VNAEIALPQGYALNEYRIESTLGIGGFGLTYLATDSNLNTKVAIKEYLPGELALRCEDQSVKSKSDSTLETFNWGRSRFLEESRTLASFRHPNIVRVMRFFEANQTAYMVMEFVAGNALNDWIKTRRPLAEQALTAIVVPLLNGLEVIHGAGYLHRDIKPGNIFIREDSSPVLLDFGSARVTHENTELTAIVSPGYAPLEQYHAHGHQGPWSDLYAMGAVLYWIVTGDKPVEATARARNDPLKPAIQAGDRSRYSAGLLNAIDWALAPSEESRPQTVAGLRNALQGVTAVPTSSQTTIVVPAQVSPLPVSSQTSPVSTPVFDSETLKKIATGLAAQIGPIAGMVVKSAAKKAVTLTELVAKVAAEIADDKMRAVFVKTFSVAEKSTPAGDPAHSAQPRSQPTQPNSSPSRFDAATLAKAETELAKYIGAVARVVVRRAAAKARDESELYLLLADQIEDKNEKKSFVRKAMSVSGRE
jgi:serine/threonine protein kinase